MAIFQKIEKLHDWNLHHIHFGVSAFLVHSFMFLAIMVTNISWLQGNQKTKQNIFISSKLQKQRLKNFRSKLFETWAYVAPNLVF